jgi:hypothetical protein
MRKPAWLTEVIVQSIAVTLSILLALWVDQWKQRRAARDLAVESMSNFVKEIRKNEARVDDILPYHEGISSMLAQVDSSHSIHTPAQFQSAIGIDGLKPPALLHTAWQTAVATGALTRLDYETVAALSQTYNMQDRFTDDSRVGFQSIMQASDFRREDADLVVRRADNYLSEVVNSENDLRATYSLTEEVLGRKLRRMGAPMVPAASGSTRTEPQAQRVSEP